MTKLAMIGCGFVANYYMLTLSKSTTLQVVGVLDTIRERAETVARRYNISTIYNSLEELIADERVTIVLNLTNPRAHFEITRTCLEAGKHVYSEKPLAMTIADAKTLAELAEKNSVQLSCAPCSVLGEAAQTVWKLIRENNIGKVRLAYVELDDDLIHKAGLHGLFTSLGSPWPAKDEFEIGCTLEHAGYYLNWLAAIFGPAKNVTAFGTSLIPDKLPGVELNPPDAPDLTVTCIEFHSGAVARLTCSSIAPHDHSIMFCGDEGVIRAEEVWDYSTTIRMQPRKWNRDSRRTPARRFGFRVWRRLCRHLPFLKTLENKLIDPRGPKQSLVRPTPPFDWEMGLHMDFSRGVQELADAIHERRPSRMSTRFSLHVTELVLAIHWCRQLQQPYQMTTDFPGMEPMPWAR